MITLKAIVLPPVRGARPHGALAGKVRPGSMASGGHLTLARPCGVLWTMWRACRAASTSLPSFSRRSKEVTPAARQAQHEAAAPRVACESAVEWREMRLVSSAAVVRCVAVPSPQAAYAWRLVALCHALFPYNMSRNAQDHCSQRHLRCLFILAQNHRRQLASSVPVQAVPAYRVGPTRPIVLTQ